jgi:hypothetical protein
MPKIIQFPMEDGNIVLIEISDENDMNNDMNNVDGFQNMHSVLPPGAVAAGAISDAFTALRHTIGSTLSGIGKSITNNVRPNELSVEFGVTLKGSAGVPVIVSHTAEAAFKIQAKWIYKQTSD